VDASVYGSWARRYAGEVGPAPGDVDVLVVISAPSDPRPVYRAGARGSERTGQPVNATVLTADDWEHGESAFVRTVRDGPRVGLLGDEFGKVLP
jgi:hypothetical protein